MAGTRQVLPTLDLRTAAQRQGVTSTQQTVQAIAGIMQVLGAKEQKRRERQTLDRVVRAVGAGATTIEAIAAAAQEDAEFSKGVPGVLQKISGAFQPGGGGGIGQGIQQAIVGQALQSALSGLTPEEQARGKRIKAGIAPPAEPPTVVEAREEETKFAKKRRKQFGEPAKISDLQKRLDTARAALIEEQKKQLGKPAPTSEEDRALKIARKNLLKAETDLKEAQLAAGPEPGEFEGLTEEEKDKARRIKAGLLPRAQAGEAVEKPTKQQAQRDRDLAVLASDKKSDFQKKEARTRLDADPSQPRESVPEGGSYDEFLDSGDKEGGKFGEKAYKAALQRTEDEARLQGLDPKTVKADFDRWWDKRVASERGGKLRRFKRNVTTPRSEFQDVSTADTDVRLQSAPDVRLDEFWADLSDEEKKEIIQRLDENPDNINQILRILQRG